MSIAAAALAAVATLSAVAADTTTPARNGVIAFVSPSFDIAIVNADGSGRTSLVSDPAADSEPAWSPDGSILAFSSYRDGDSEIYVMDMETKSVRQLTHNRGVSDWSPTWAPTGASIAFVRSGKGRLFVMRANGSRQRPLTSTRRHYWTASWSPNGKTIALLESRGVDKYGVSMLNVGTRRVTRIPQVDTGPPAWSPDGTRIAFTQFIDGGCDTYDVPPFGLARAATPPPCVGLVISRPNGRVVNSWFNRDQDYGDPVWSPDGTAMVLSGLQTFRLRAPGSFRFLGVEGADPSWQPLCSIPGSAGPDALRGTDGRDLVCGFDGDDRVRGGNGADRLFGGRGDDRIVARDRGSDVIGCGPGNDYVTADRRDLVGRDCERVSRS